VIFFILIAFLCLGVRWFFINHPGIAPEVIYFLPETLQVSIYFFTQLYPIGGKIVSFNSLKAILIMGFKRIIFQVDGLAGSGRLSNFAFLLSFEDLILHQIFSTAHITSQFFGLLGFDFDFFFSDLALIIISLIWAGL
jgi:hypothetical protein